MKHLLIFSTALFLSFEGYSATENSKKSLAIPPTSNSSYSSTANVTYASEYMMDGFKLGGGAPVMELSLKIDTPSKRFSFMYWSALPINRDKKENDEHDLFVLYHQNFLNNSRYAFEFHSFYDYWFYPNSLPYKDNFGDTISDVHRHGSKVHAGISMFNLLPLSESVLIPSYNIYYWIYWAQDRRDLYQGGTHHEFLLKYTHWIPRIFSFFSEAYAGTSASLNYNDGAFGVRPGLSHSTASLLAEVKTSGASLVASVNQQWSYEPTVNPTNDFWTEISLLKEF